VPVRLSEDIETNWDLVKAAVVEFRAMTCLEANIGAHDISLRGPVIAASKAAAVVALSAQDEAELFELVNPTINGAWFFLEIGHSSSGGNAGIEQNEVRRAQFLLNVLVGTHCSQ